MVKIFDEIVVCENFRLVCIGLFRYVGGIVINVVCCRDFKVMMFNVGGIELVLDLCGL